MERAREAARSAYVPYCNFPVGAAVEFADGSVVTGANVDNASYPLTQCAERGAIATGIAQGHRLITAVAVFGPADSVSPCGGCRQVIAQFASDDCQITFRWEGRETTVPFAQLLPYSFSLERST